MAVRMVDLPASLGPTMRWMSRSLKGSRQGSVCELPVSDQLEFANGASLSMVSGLAISFYYMVKTHPWMYGLFHEGSLTPEILKANTWWDIAPISARIFGVPVGFAVIIIVSLLTKEPEKEVQDMVENVRFPSFDGTCVFHS